MKRYIGTLFMALLAISVSTLSLRAQWHTHDSRMYFDYGDPMMTSVIQSPDGLSADVRVTTASAMFSFQRAKNQARGAYFAIRDVTVEVNEENNPQPLVTKNTVDTLYVPNFEQSTSKEDWHAMREKLALPTLDPKKKYSMKIEVRDGIDHLVMRPVITPIRVTACNDRSDSCGVAFGDIMLLDSMKGTTAYSSARGNTYMFSHDIIGTVSFRLSDTIAPDPLVDIRVRQLTNVAYPADTGDRSVTALKSSDIHKDTTLAFDSESGTLRYTLVPTSDKHSWTAVFTVPGKAFEQGKYQMAVRVKSGMAERWQKNDFNILWQNMPISLEDPAAAIQPLQYILDDAEWKAMQSGSRQEMTHKLYTYWRKQDPTPGTAYNERMAAFYARADYADFNFATTHLLDGVMTDRGKIYLLYGAPTNTERSFLPGESPVETWTYSNNVKRVFRFEEHTHGEYKLTDVRELAARN